MPRKLTNKSIAPPLGEPQSFVAGERVRLSALGQQRCPRMRGYFGEIIGKASGSGYYVLFEGFKTKQMLHNSYLVSDNIAAREA